MAEAENSDKERQDSDPAEALANLAAGREQPPVDSSELSGAPEGPPEVLDQMAAARDDAADELDRMRKSEADDVDQGLAAVTGLSGRQASRAKQARSVRIGGQQAQAHAHAYKKMMIPLLLVVGVLLILIGALDVTMLAQADEGELRTRWHALMAAIALASFPLGAILLFGAWWFRREVKG